MNIANYLQGNRYPLSTQGLDFIQNQVLTVQRLSAVLGVGKWIIDGCEEVTENGVVMVTSGAVIVNKEVVEVAKQPKKTTCYIKETTTTTPSRVERGLVFGTNVDATLNLSWGNFSRVDISALATKLEVEALRNLVLPKGAIIMWSGTVNEESSDFPSGFRLCDGRVIEGYGTLPDLRSRFIVGFDARTSNQTIDYSAIGITGGESKHTLSVAEMPSHSHKQRLKAIASPTWRGGGNNSGNNATTQHDAIVEQWNTLLSGGGEEHENRPPYYTLAFIIKVI